MLFGAALLRGPEQPLLAGLAFVLDDPQPTSTPRFHKRHADGRWDQWKGRHRVQLWRSELNVAAATLDQEPSQLSVKCTSYAEGR